MGSRSSSSKLNGRVATRCESSHLATRQTERAIDDVIGQFSALCAECEGALPVHRLVALDIPPTADVASIKHLLIDGEANERWGYDEGCIDDRWREL